MPVEGDEVGNMIVPLTALGTVRRSMPITAAHR